MAHSQIEKDKHKKKPIKKVEPKQKTAPLADGNVGEGDRASDRKYRDDVRQFVATDNPEKRARDAQSAIERDPQKFADAERAGKARIAEEDPEVIDGTFEETETDPGHGHGHERTKH